MKLHYIKAGVALIVLLSITATGCLKDKEFNNGEIQSVHATGTVPKIVEIKLTASSVDNFLSLGLNNGSADTTINFIPINLATDAPAPQDIHVTMVQNNSLVDDYNTANGTSFTIPTAFTIVNPVVIIPKGQHTGYLQIKLNPSDFLGKSDALGFSIEKIDEGGYDISGNNKNGIVSINIKNAYDADYTVDIDLVHPSAGGHYHDNATHFKTINSNTSEAFLAVMALFAPSSKLTIEVNPDNSLTLSSNAVAIASDGPTLNYYDPANKTFHFSYGWSGGSRHVTGTAVRNP